ncbi:hypothetical protein [Anaplasma marginale]|nr:hypothetical protein [Anaplasma marginale]
MGDTSYRVVILVQRAVAVQLHWVPEEIPKCVGKSGMGVFSDMHIAA